MRLIDADDFIKHMEILYEFAGWEEKEVHFSLADIKMNIASEIEINQVAVIQGADESLHYCSKCKEYVHPEEWYVGGSSKKDMKLKRICPICGNELE